MRQKDAKDFRKFSRYLIEKALARLKAENPEQFKSLDVHAGQYSDALAPRQPQK